MRFAYPELRLLLVSIPILILLFWWVSRRRRRLQQTLGDRSLLASLLSRSPKGWVLLRQTLVLLAVLFLTLAAARPQAALDWVNVQQQGIDLVIALDISESMSAEDVKPSRLARAKQDVKDLLSSLSGDRVALVVFAGQAIVQAPLTVDYGAIRLLLDVTEPGMLARPGTAIEEALDRALQCFDVEDQSQARAVLLITDGESHEGDIQKAIDRLSDAGVRVYALGMGRVEGEPIPVRDDTGGVSYKSDREGKVVMTRLDEATLQQIAVATGGAYVPVGDGSQGVDHVAQLIEDLEEKAFEAGLYKLYEDRYVFFLVPGLILMVLEFFLGDLVRRRG